MDKLEQLTTLATAFVAAKKKVGELESELQEAKARFLALEREDLPQLMKELELKEVRLKSGERVALGEGLDVGITEANLPKAVAWLDERGFGGIVKTAVTAAFSRAEREQAKALYKELVNRHVDAQHKASIHHSTLKAFVKEQMAAGAPLPMDLFGVRTYDKATVSK